MKKTLRFFALFAGILFSMLTSQKASAQVTAINMNFNDSFSTYCNTPANVIGDVFFWVAGTPDPLDSITVYINYGDGTDLTYKIETPVQGYNFTVNHTYNTTGTYNISITLTNTNGVTNSVVGQNYEITNNCSALNGQVWIDSDGDCTFDVGENPLTYRFVEITNTTTGIYYYAITNSNGFYYAEVPDGFTYEIDLFQFSNSLSPVCPVSGVATQAVSGMNTYTNDFGYTCSTNAPSDLWVNLYANNHRPGHTRNMFVYASSDNMCNAVPATVTLQLHPLLTYTGTTSGTPPTTVNGQTLTWDIPALSSFTPFLSQLEIFCDSTAILGTYLCSDAYISYTGVVDTNLANDTVQLCKLVSNSWDPNNKEAGPMVDAQGHIQNGQHMNYVINFQNTGNDTAYNVVIVDTISNNLKVETFHMIEASHPVNITWLNGNIINFRFEDIYLPDSNVNEPASHGFVMYGIDAKTGLVDGDVINNTAHIYFDFNPAIITNTTVNTIEIPTHVRNVTNGDISAKVYPNPANNELTITTDGKNFSARVFDLMGRPVATSVTNNGKVVINTSSLANGLYILNINAGGKEMTTKVNVQH